MAATPQSSAWRQITRRFGLERFFGWWFGELSAMAAGILSGATKASIGRQVLVTFGTEAVISRIADGKVVELGRVDTALEDTAQKQAFLAVLEKTEESKSVIALYLAPDQVLCNKLNLPLAAEENLGQVLAFEMDRIMPFRAEQVYFDYRYLRGDAALEVSLAVAQRAVVDELLRKLAVWGVQPVAVRASDDAAIFDAAAGEPWNLMPGGMRRQGGKADWSRIDLALAGGALLLLCAVLAFPVWQKRETVIALHPLVDGAHRQAQVAENLRHRLEASLAEYNYLLDKKRAVPPVVAVLEDVTHILPDDTWVQQFDLKGKELVIQGETGSSSKLIGLFEHARTLRNANFRAPLTKGRGENSERFQLAAETKPLLRAETEETHAVQQAESVVPAAEQAASAVASAEENAASAEDKTNGQAQAEPVPAAKPETAGEDTVKPTPRTRRKPLETAS